MDLAQLLGELEAPTGVDSGSALAADLAAMTQQFDTLKREASKGEPTAAGSSGAEVNASLSKHKQEVKADLKQQIRLARQKSKEALSELTLAWGNGVKYEGSAASGRPHGAGTMVFPTGARYEGDFKFGERDGRGTYVYTNDARYEGEWRAGMRDGYGKLVFPSGATAVGEFHNGEPKEFVWTTANSRGVFLKDSTLVMADAAPNCTLSRVAPTLAHSHSNSNSNSQTESHGELSEAEAEAVLQALRDPLAQFACQTRLRDALYLSRVSLRKAEALANARLLSGLIAEVSQLAQTFKPSLQHFAQVVPKGATLYRVVLPEESRKIGLWAPEPLADFSAEEFFQTTKTQFQLLTVDATWALYHVCKLRFETRSPPLVVAVDLARCVGRLSKVERGLASFTLLEGYIPPAAVTKSFAFRSEVPTIHKLFSVTGEGRTHTNFESFPAWLHAFSQQMSGAQIAQLLRQAHHCWLHESSPDLRF